MKFNSRVLAMVILPALLLTACGSATPTATPTPTMDVLAEQSTAVAITLTAIAMQATPTTLPTDTATPTPESSPTSALTLTVVAPTSVQACYNAAFVADTTIPDNTALAPGATFTKTWSMLNNGTCQWETTFQMVFVSGDSMSGVSTNLTAVVPSGATANVSVKMVAPATAGTYTGYWQLKDGQGNSFGVSPYVKIVVSGASVTSTVTPTVTATPH